MDLKPMYGLLITPSCSHSSLFNHGNTKMIQYQCCHVEGNWSYCNIKRKLNPECTKRKHSKRWKKSSPRRSSTIINTQGYFKVSALSHFCMKDSFLSLNFHFNMIWWDETHANTHTHAHAYHKDEGAKTLCQGLTKQQVTNLEEAGQFVQIYLLPAHVSFLETDETERRQALMQRSFPEWLWSWEDRALLIVPRWAWTGPVPRLSLAPPSPPPPVWFTLWFTHSSSPPLSLSLSLTHINIQLTLLYVWAPSLISFIIYQQPPSIYLAFTAAYPSIMQLFFFQSSCLHFDIL